VECRIATAFLRVGYISRYHIFRVSSLNPEHEAIGRVLWVELDKIVQLLLRSGAPTPGSYEIKSLSQEWRISTLTQGC
jgi:hypothetical protein